MGYAKLNIWVRDKDCSVLNGVWAMSADVYACCRGTIVKSVKIGGDSNKTVEPHVNVEIPPGCYVVKCHVCVKSPGPPGNYDSERAMVIVRCGEEACVNVFAPTLKDCAKAFIPPFIAEAQRIQKPEEIRAVVDNLMKVTQLKQEDLVAKIDRRMEYFKSVDAKEHIEELKKIKKVLA